MHQLDHFFNDGFGWTCRHCHKELGEEAEKASSRLLSEGEAESKKPALSSSALAKWADAARLHLMCPRCGIQEPVSKA